MRGILSGDSKPRNYNYLTFNIIFSTSSEGKVEILKTLEQLILKTIIHTPPQESLASLRFVRVFSGKSKAMELSMLLLEISRKKKLAGILMKVNRVKFN